MRAEILDSLADARRRLAVWRYDDNTVRQHSSRGGTTPAEARPVRSPRFAQAPGAPAPPETDHHQPQGLSS
jgi:putative transposase